MSENKDIPQGTFEDFLRERVRDAQLDDAAARGIYPATEEEWTETVATLQQRISDLEEDLDIVHEGLRRSAAEHDYKASKDIARDALMEYAVVQLKRAGLLDGIKTMVVDISQCGRCNDEPTDMELAAGCCRAGS